MTGIEPKRVTVLGGGSWGTALGVLLARGGHRVVVWDHDPAVREDIAKRGLNERYLPGLELPERMGATEELADALDGAEVLVMATPAAGVEDAAGRAAPMVPKGCRVVSATKGLCPRTGRRMSQVLQETLGVGTERIVALSGPNLALEIVAEVPTATVVSGSSREATLGILRLFSAPTLRVYSNPDTVGVELG
ncbi:MAG: hypothetical protein GF320_01855, partial [Armatimonadia bacterium]|nr:hypothetical protein [Armatimonadia bacterium]